MAVIPKVIDSQCNPYQNHNINLHRNRKSNSKTHMQSQNTLKKIQSQARRTKMESSHVPILKHITKLK